jgi:nitric-oxide synthase
MRIILAGSPKHRLWSLLSDVRSEPTPLRTHIAPAPCTRVVLLVDHSDWKEAAASLHAMSGATGVRLLVVLPATSPGAPPRQALQASIDRLQVDSLAYAPLTETILHTANGVSSRRELVLCPLSRPVPWLATEDLADAVRTWLQGAWSGHRVLSGPEALDGGALAGSLSRVLRDLHQPEEFVRQRFLELDEDGNGVVETDEAVRYLERLGQPSAAARAMVDAADLDGDGTINPEELVHGLGEFLEATLSSTPTDVVWRPVPATIVRDEWVRAGMAFADATAKLAHIGHCAVPADAHRGTRTVNQVLEGHALRFANLHVLPGRGLFTHHTGRFGDPNPGLPELLWDGSEPQLMHPAVLSRKRLPTGETLVSRKGVGGAPVEVRWLGTGPREVLRFGEGDQARAIELEHDQVVGLACRGEWPGLRDTMADVLERRTLKAWEKALFRELGALRIEHVDELADPLDVICHCTGTRRCELVSRCEGRATTLAMLADETGVTRVCGGCAPLVEEIVGSTKLEVAEVMDRTQLGPGIFRFTLRPVATDPMPSLPGQHIVVQGRIQDRWVTRAYTLTSPGGLTQAYELTIKREELGLFSRWLVDSADSTALLRCSAPCGDVFIGPDERGPIFAFAGGIGITPGLAVARTIGSDGSGRTVHIDWSARTPEDFIFAEELDGLAGTGVTWTRRCTTRQGRLDAETVRARYPWREGAIALVCGPSRYCDDVVGWLRGCGWPDDAVRVEVFSSQVNDKGEVRAKRAAPPPSPAVDGTTVDAVQADSFFIDLDADRDVVREAVAFMRQMYAERGLAAVLPSRLAEVRSEVEETGSYTLTRDELAYGAQLAWRNSTRCIGRFFWQHLQVRDMRHLQTEEEMFASLVEHMRLATNGGDLISTLTVFRTGEPEVRLWNGQLIRYAGYRQPDGTVVGDPANCELTERIEGLGWQGRGGRFDVLPLVIQIGDRPPRWFEIPEDAVLEVPIEHPDHPWFAELGLRWYALPAVSELALDVGGVVHRCVPFNGFYMVTEIGARNL